MMIQVCYAVCACIMLTAILAVTIRLKYSILLNLSGWVLAFYLFFDIFSSNIAKAIPLFSPVAIPAILLVSCMIISWINDRQCLKKLFINKAFVICLIVVLYFLASSLFGCNPSYGLKKWAIWLFKGFFSGVNVAILSISFKRLNLRPVIYAGIVCAFLVIFFGEEKLLYPNRIVFGTANPIWVSRSLFLMITLCIWYDKNNSVFRAFSSSIGLYGAYLTGSRGPLIGAMISNLITISKRILSRDALNQVKRIIAIVLIIATAGLTFIYKNINMENILDKKARFKVLFSRDLLEKDKNVIGRIEIQKKAIRVWKNNPIFGTGLGGFAPKNERLYPHNLVIELLCEGGIVGFGLWLAMMIIIWVKFTRNSIIKVLFLQSVIYTFVSGDFGSNFEYMLLGLPSIAYGDIDIEI